MNEEFKTKIQVSKTYSIMELLDQRTNAWNRQCTHSSPPLSLAHPYLCSPSDAGIRRATQPDLLRCRVLKEAPTGPLPRDR